MYLDNSALISRIEQWKYNGPTGTLRTDYDLLQLSMQLAKELQIDLIPYHIMADQDEDLPYNQLPWQAQLNCDFDHQAAQVQRCNICANIPRIYKLPPVHKATLQIGPTHITTHLPLAIRNAIYRDEMVHPIMKSAGWDTSFVFDLLVDWEAYNLALQKLRGSKKMTIFKMEFELLVTLPRQSKYNRSVDNRCFRCKQLNQDVNYVIH